MAWQGRARPGTARRGMAWELSSSTSTRVHEMTISTSQPKEITREAITRWEAQRPALKRLNDATLDKPRGHTITPAELVAIAGGPKEFEKAKGYWKKSILWLRGITIEYEAAIKAYRFINVEAHLTTRHDRVMRSAERKHRLESLRLSLIRDNDMESDHQRRLRLLQREQHNSAAGKINAAREASRIALAQPETLPKII